MSAARLFAICATGLSLFGCLGGGTANSADPSTAEPATILAVGDIAQCGALPAADSAAARTAAVVDGQAPDLPLLLLGDLVYNSGTLAEYLNCYAPTYGKFMARSFPAPGNHDYGVPAGDDYFTYFGTRAGPGKRGYYSFDVGSWHIVSLNSNIDMAKGSAQEAWLRADLAAASSRKCTLAYWHHPRFSSSSTHGDDPRSSDIWRVLLEFGADVVLVGHDHTYERFAPQDADANADPQRNSAVRHRHRRRGAVPIWRPQAQQRSPRRRRVRRGQVRARRRQVQLGVPARGRQHVHGPR